MWSKRMVILYCKELFEVVGKKRSEYGFQDKMRLPARLLKKKLRPWDHLWNGLPKIYLRLACLKVLMCRWSGTIYKRMRTREDFSMTLAVRFRVLKRSVLSIERLGNAKGPNWEDAHTLLIRILGVRGENDASDAGHDRRTGAALGKH